MQLLTFLIYEDLMNAKLYLALNLVYQLCLLLTWFYNWFHNLLTFSVLVKHITVSKSKSFDEIGTENVSFDWQIHPMPWQNCSAILLSKHDFVTLFSVPSADFSIFDYKISMITWQFDLWYLKSTSKISPHSLYTSVTSFTWTGSLKGYFGVLSC